MPIAQAAVVGGSAGWAVAIIAQAAVLNGFVGWAIVIVGVLAVIALLCIACKQYQITIPPFIIQVFWVCVAAVILISAILFVARIAGWA